MKPHAVTRPVADATSEALTLEQAKLHLRVTDDSEDDAINDLIKRARLHVQREMGRSIMSCTWKLTLDWFPSVVFLRFPPVTAVSSVTYYDTSGTVTTLSTDDYIYDLQSEMARVTPAYGKTWPATQSRIAAVTVNYTAGYASASAVPEPIKHAMLLLINHWYEMRSAVTQGNSKPTDLAVESLLAPYMVAEYA
jgi:uncharacterized phiE125 gp8 family phage protein